MLSNKLGVAFFVNQFGAGGAERQLLELVRGLDKGAFDVTVITLYPGGALAPEFEKLREVRLVCLDRRGKYDFLPVLKAARLLRKLKAQVVQAFLPVASVLGLTAAMLAGTPVRIATKRTGGQKKKSSFGDGLYRSLEIPLARRAHAVVANSEAGREFMVQKGVSPSRASVILNGISPARLSGSDEGAREEIRRTLKPTPDVQVVGMAANLTHEKDHESLLRAAAVVNQSRPNTMYALLGDGPTRPHLEGLRDELGLTGKAIFFGYREDVAAFYEFLDLAVLATLHPEGHSNFLLEAMLAGKPVVATDTGGTRELIEHGTTGLLVPRSDPEALATAMLELLAGQERTAQVARAGQELVQARFGLDRMVEEYAGLYRGLHSQVTAGRRGSVVAGGTTETVAGE